jgi:hypothetical protein
VANTGFKGIDVRQIGTALVFRSLLQSGSALVTTGTTSLYLYELQSDSTLLSYDFSSNTFKSTALTTETLAMTHKQGNNSTTNTGFWSASLATLTGFTIGAVYLARVVNSLATPTDQIREFQYGSAEGDLILTASGATGQSFLRVDVRDWNGQAAAADGNFLPNVNVVDWAGTAVTAYATATSQASILSAVQAITTNTARGRSVVPTFMARPSASTTAFEIDLQVYSLQGQLEAPDAAPTVAARNSAGTSLNAQLSSTTMTLVGVGKYKVNYTVNSTDATGEVFFDFTWAVGGVTFSQGDVTQVQDAEQLSTLNAIVAKTNLLTFDGSNNIKANLTVYAAGQDPATLLLDVAASGHNSAGTIGAKINASGSASDPLANATSVYTTPGTIGYVVGHNLDTTVGAAVTASGAAATAANTAATAAGTASTGVANVQAAINKTQVSGAITAISGSTVTIASPSQTLGALGLLSLATQTATFEDSAANFKTALAVQSASATGGLALVFASLPNGIAVGDQVFVRVF